MSMSPEAAAVLKAVFTAAASARSTETRLLVPLLRQVFEADGLTAPDVPASSRPPAKTGAERQAKYVAEKRARMGAGPPISSSSLSSAGSSNESDESDANDESDVIRGGGFLCSSPGISEDLGSKKEPVTRVTSPSSRRHSVTSNANGDGAYGMAIAAFVEAIQLETRAELPIHLNREEVGILVEAFLLLEPDASKRIERARSEGSSYAKSCAGTSKLSGYGYRTWVGSNRVNPSGKTVGRPALVQPNRSTTGLDFEVGKKD